MYENFKKLLKSFQYAFRGIILCIENERNFRIHIVIAIYTLILAIILKLNRIQFAILFLTFGSVISMEAINTAIERIVDIISPQHNDLAKIAKDVAAGAVLINAIISIIIAFCLLYQPQKLIDLLNLILSNPYYILIFILSLITSIVFIFNNIKIIK